MGRAGEGQRQRHRVAEKKAGGEGRRGQGAGTGSLRGFCEGTRVLLCLLMRRRGPVLEDKAENTDLMSMLSYGLFHFLAV